MGRERVVLWGTGHIANEIFKHCVTLNQYEIVAVIDNDKSKQGKFFFDNIINDSSYIYENKDQYESIVILTGAYEEIRSEIIAKDNSLKYRIHNYNYFYKKSILKRYAGTSDIEIKRIIEYLNNNNLEIFNYKFTDNYQSLEIEVYKDENNGLFYVFHDGKKMYFSREYKNVESVKEYYKSILMEQDEESPHRYLTKDFCVNRGDIVVDVGVAEGNFSLDIIEHVDKLYLVEADQSWVEALRYTFEPYKEKVVIINKYANSYNEGDFGTLDSMIKDDVNFIKMDIEGCEWDALIGAQRLVSESKNLKLAICSYHSDFDQTLIEDYMDKMKIKHTTTKGYMWFPVTIRQPYVSTKLNKAIVRGEKLQ